ncbi:DUF3341 domain-containing protein [Thermus thermamylovorans]|uniref:DUF3341 domain-containing protein n=1 Tax=Thermus thermamylovorans TaxID=2509362 RepID=A0A4Q9B6P1_9DEIN|nr:DUF3341 domain-containing protein [Thermus thermamylovorans]TBH20752.1 DUF3341 domain-containing protein [Thermus thermamylovorans]
MLYGIMAYFDAPERLLSALRVLREEGYRQFEALAPGPLEGLEEALGQRRDEAIPWAAFAFGVLGLGLGLFLQIYTSLDYPINAGGKPLLGWPAFIPVTFEITILTIALGIFLLLLYMTGLPRAAHPAVLARGYPGVLVDRYGIFVYVTDPRFHPTATRSLLESLGAQVEEVGGG